MKRSALVVLVTAGALALSGCSREAPPQPDPSITPYMALAAHVRHDLTQALAAVPRACATPGKDCMIARSNASLTVVKTYVATQWASVDHTGNKYFISPVPQALTPLWQHFMAHYAPVDQDAQRYFGDCTLQGYSPSKCDARSDRLNHEIQGILNGDLAAIH